MRQSERTTSVPTPAAIDFANTARYLAQSLREGHNDVEEVVEALAGCEADHPGALRAVLSPRLTGTADDLAMALIFEVAASEAA